VRRPATARRARPALAALGLAALALAACAEDAQRCPGVAEGTLTFSATRTLAACAAGGPAAGLDALYPPAFTFTAIVAFATEGPGAAVCTLRRSSTPLSGTHQGDDLAVAVDTGGAVYGACAATCGVAVRQALAGTLTRDPASGAVTGFTGTLTEVGEAAAGAACAPCTAPCTATWAVTGAAP
jgi:hypothetical protein